MEIIATIPAPLVRLLRHGLLSELGNAGAQMSLASIEPGREHHPEWFVEPLQHADACRELLAEIGCSQPDWEESIDIDLAEHYETVERALCARLAAEYDFYTSMPDRKDRKQTRRNIRHIEQFLAEHELGEDASRSQLAKARLLGSSLAHDAGRLAGSLRWAYAQLRLGRLVPDDPEAHKTIVLRLLLRGGHGAAYSIRQLAPYVGGHSRLRHALDALCDADLAWTIKDEVMPSVAATAFNRINPLKD